MTIKITIQYDTARSGRGASAYRVDMIETTDAVQPLAQVGPVYNDWITYSGVFESVADAIGAMSGVVCDLWKLVETDTAGDKRVHLLSPADRVQADEFTRVRVLASRSPRGTFIAEAQS